MKRQRKSKFARGKWTWPTWNDNPFPYPVLELPEPEARVPFYKLQAEALNGGPWILVPVGQRVGWADQEKLIGWCAVSFDWGDARRTVLQTCIIAKSKKRAAYHAAHALNAALAVVAGLQDAARRPDALQVAA